MTPPPDFEFAFGKGRYLRGHGWRGLVALSALMAGVLAATGLGGSLVTGGLRVARLLGP